MHTNITQIIATTTSNHASSILQSRGVTFDFFTKQRIYLKQRINTKVIVIVYLVNKR